MHFVQYIGQENSKNALMFCLRAGKMIQPTEKEQKKQTLQETRFCIIHFVNFLRQTNEISKNDNNATQQLVGSNQQLATSKTHTQEGSLLHQTMLGRSGQQQKPYILGSAGTFLICSQRFEGQVCLSTVPSIHHSPFHYRTRTLDLLLLTQLVYHEPQLRLTSRMGTKENINSSVFKLVNFVQGLGLGLLAIVWVIYICRIGHLALSANSALGKKRLILLSSTTAKSWGGRQGFMILNGYLLEKLLYAKKCTSTTHSATLYSFVDDGVVYHQEAECNPLAHQR